MFIADLVHGEAVPGLHVPFGDRLHERTFALGHSVCVAWLVGNVSALAEKHANKTSTTIATKVVESDFFMCLPDSCYLMKFEQKFRLSARSQVAAGVATDISRISVR